MVNWAKTTNLNALIVQVVKRGDSYYASGSLPRASDVSADYDSLADVVDQAHEAGLQVHAWISVYAVSHTSYSPSPSHVVSRHPEWVMITKSGNKALHKGNVFLDPGIPAVREHLVSVVTEIVEKYEVDGIHLDYAMYPGPNCGYNPTSVALFNSEYGRNGVPEFRDAAWSQWRCAQITRLVSDIRAAISTHRPGAKLSASVTLESAEDAATYYLQDWGEWTKAGLVDFVVPLAFTSKGSMSDATVSAMKSSYGRGVYMGIGVWKLTPDVTAGQIRDARTSGAAGVALFSYHYMSPSSENPSCARSDDLVSSVFQTSCSVP